MVRILPGESWKLNPSYLASLKLAAGKAPRFAATSILDVLGIEVDGVNVSQGLSEAAIFDVVDALSAVVLRLCRDPSGGGQVSVCEGSTELVLGRRGDKASLCLVSLARPARILAGELEVDLSALAQATASCATALLADLSGVNEALARSVYSRRLAKRSEALRKAAQLSGRKSARPAGKPLVFSEPAPAQAPEGPSLGFALFDEEGRIEAYRKGGDLYSLLGPGEVFLRDARGVPMAVVRSPPFLILTDLARAAGDLVEAHTARQASWEGLLAPGAARLRLDLKASLLSVEGRAISCSALALARSFLQAALDYGGAIVARNALQAKNPYLAALADSARERLEHLREVEGGDVFAEGRALPAAARSATGAPLGTGTLKRLRFRIAWRGVDTGGRARALQIGEGALLVVGERRATFLDAATGELLARRGGDAAVLAEMGALVSDRSRLIGLSRRGEPRFLRDQPGHDQPPLTGSAGAVLAGPERQPATVCQLEGSLLTAILSASGRAAWHFRAPQALRLSAASTGDRVFAAADNGFLYALEAAQGQVVFRVRAGCAFEGPLYVGGGLVASLGRQDGALWLAAVDAASGRPRLARPLPLRAAGAPLFHRRRLVLGGVADGESQVLAFKLTGEEAWRASLGASAGVPALSVHGGRIFASLRDGSVACLGAGGKLAWKVPGCGLELDHAAAPLLRREVLIAAGDPMRALDPETGALLCELPATQGLSALAVGAPLDLFAVDDDGVVACFQLATHLSVV